MYIIIPEEKKKLERLFTPYLDGVKLKADAPPEVMKAYQDFNEWFKEQTKNEQ